MICTAFAMVMTTITLSINPPQRGVETICLPEQAHARQMLDLRKVMMTELQAKDHHKRKVTAEVFTVLPDGTWHKLYDLE